MPISSSNFTTLAYGKETTYGTVPTGVPLREIPMTGESFQFSKESISSQNINSNRQVSDTVQTGFETSGGLQIEMAPKVFDELISGCMWNDWSTPVALNGLAINVTAASRTLSVNTGTPFTGLTAKQFIRLSGFASDLNNGIFQIAYVSNDFKAIDLVNNGRSMTDENGTTISIRACMIRNDVKRKSFFFERTHKDLVPAQYFAFNGCLVNSFNVSASSASLLTGGFEVMGQTSQIYNDNVEHPTNNPNGRGDGSVGSGSKSDGTTLPPLPFNGLNAVSHVGDICIDGIAINTLNEEDSIFMQSLDFSVSNNLRGVKAIGVKGNVDVSPGQLAVTGTLSALFAGDKMYRRYVDGSEFSLSYSVFDDKKNGYVFYFPRVTISSSTLNAEKTDQDLVEQMNWSAIMSTDGTKTSVQIDRLYNEY